MTWNPETYPVTIRAEIHDYDELQDQVARATSEVNASSILELGIGSGETALRVLRIHPEAQLLGIDSSPEMLDGAARLLSEERVTLLQQDLAAPLPQETFDVIVSSLAIHHLPGDGKAKLFEDVARHLRPGGCFVMGDVVVPDDPADALIENEPGYDHPSSIDEQLTWMKRCGLSPVVLWTCKDLAVVRAEIAQA